MMHTPTLRQNPAPLKPPVILMVEDDPAHAEIIRRNMERHQIANRLEHVRDGQEALDYLFRQDGYADPDDSPRPDIILLDLHLPKVDGLEVLRRVKADPSLSAIPVIVLTTSANQPDILGAYAHQASSYLVKPVDFERFATLMESFGNYWLRCNRLPGS